MTEIPARLYRDLTDDEKREIELEENVRRKDLTPYERSKNLVALAETAEKVLLSDNKTSKPKGGRPTKGAVSEQAVADRIGADRMTVVNAKQHVAAVERYPELAAPGIPRHADYAPQTPPCAATSRQTSRKGQSVYFGEDER